jgi:hypothetical protein
MSLSYNINPKYKQGFYHPKNTEKYLGTDVPFYRSSIEAKFMAWCDNTPNVLKWASEAISIPYYDKIKKRSRLYYIDNYVEILEGSTIKKYLIELKDHKETKKPDPRSKKKKSTLLIEQSQWITNNCKWASAKAFAEKNGMEFLLFAHDKSGFSSVKLDFLV